MQFELDRNIDAAANDVQTAINAAGGQLPKNLPNPPTYRKVNPADSPILILGVHIGRRCRSPRSTTSPTNKLAQRISQMPGVGQVDIGGAAEAGGAHPDRPGQARRQGPVARGCAQPCSARPPSTAPRARIDGKRRAFTIYANDQLTAAAELERRDRRLSQRRAVAVQGYRPARSSGPEDTKQAAWAERQARHLPRGIQAAGRQRHRHRRQDQGSSCRSCTAANSAGIKVSVMSDRTTTIRASVARCAVHAAADDRAGRARDLRLLAQHLGDDHSERHRAARSARRLRR